MVAWAIDGVLVGFEALLALHLDVTAGCCLVDAHGEKLSWVQRALHLALSYAAQIFAA